MRSATLLVAALVLLTAVAGPAGAATGVATADSASTATSDHSVDCEFPFSATDATETEVTVDEEPERIVTLNPSAAQTMWEIGGEAKVVGVSQYAAYLDGADAKANVSASGQAFVNVEKVIDLEPDLVLAPNTIPNETVSQLREAGLTVYKFPYQTSIDDIEEKTLLMGQLTGECEGAEETVAWMESELDTVERAVEGEERPDVLYVFFGYTAGTGTFAHTVIETGGGNNVAADANISGYQQISQEVVVETNPEWIVLNDGATQIPQTEAYNSTTAVQKNQTVVLREEYISQPAPRIVHSIVKLAQTLHPEAYEQAAANQTAGNATEATTGTTEQTEATTEAPEQTATSEATPAETSTNTPGFGPGVAVVAVALSTLLFRRTRN